MGCDLMRPALFLDRDGILNVDTGHPHRPADIVLIPGALDLCRAGMARGFSLVIVTNQGGIGRGLYTEADFAALMRWMLDMFARQGIYFLDVEHCPYHPTAGIGHYRRDSPRRKPNPGMILDAAAKHRLTLPRSVMIGDRATDAAAACAAGVGTVVLVSSSPAECAAVPDGTVIVPTVCDAASWMRCGGRMPGRESKLGSDGFRIAGQPAIKPSR